MKTLATRLIAKFRALPLRMKIVGGVTLLVLVVGGAAWAFASGTGPKGNGSLEHYADEVIAACSKDSYPPRCYDIEIPKLMDKGLTMEQAFAVTSIIQGRVSNYFYCHVLGHNLSAKETSKDPSQWTKVIARCPVGMCSNGCLHGAAQERFRSESLTDAQIDEVLPELSTICQGDRTRAYTGLEQASCYHSMGHLTMYLTQGNIDKSTVICDRIAKPNGADFTQTCYEGAYMQIFQPLEPEDFTLVKDIAPETAKEAEEYCNQFTGQRQSSCHRESWPLYRESLDEPEGLTYFCNLVPNPADIKRCYNAIFYVLVAQFNFEAERIIPLCKALPETRKAQCFANAASRFVETDYRLSQKAADLCRVAEKEGVGNRCYDELLFYSTFNFKKGTESFNQFCGVLPDPWKTRCLNGEGATMNLGNNDLIVE